MQITPGSAGSNCQQSNINIQISHQNIQIWRQAMSLRSYQPLTWAKITMKRRGQSIFGTELWWPWSLVLSLSGLTRHGRPNGNQISEAVLEERCSFKLEITGTLIDSYLKEIGRAFLAKLGRSKCSGLMPPIKSQNLQLQSLCNQCSHN